MILRDSVDFNNIGCPGLSWDPGPRKRIPVEESEPGQKSARQSRDWQASKNLKFRVATKILHNLTYVYHVENMSSDQPETLCVPSDRDRDRNLWDERDRDKILQDFSDVDVPQDCLVPSHPMPILD